MGAAENGGFFFYGFLIIEYIHFSENNSVKWYNC